ncbi:hypothetical protein HK102_008837 [Quaeritorhiza haematococci]|nr:hypothetical protein HK102_008837 [Quaeritorhiza haematococci]
MPSKPTSTLALQDENQRLMDELRKERTRRQMLEEQIAQKEGMNLGVQTDVVTNMMSLEQQDCGRGEGLQKEARCQTEVEASKEQLVESQAEVKEEQRKAACYEMELELTQVDAAAKQADAKSQLADKQCEIYTLQHHVLELKDAITEKEYQISMLKVSMTTAAAVQKAQTHSELTEKQEQIIKLQQLVREPKNSIISQKNAEIAALKKQIKKYKRSFETKGAVKNVNVCSSMKVADLPATREPLKPLS